MYNLDDDDVSGWEGRLDGGVEHVEVLPYFQNHHVQLDPGESFEFRAEARVSAQFVEWVLEVQVEAGSHRHSWHIRAPDGDPFRTTNCNPNRFGSGWYCGVATPGGGYRPADPSLAK